MRNRATGESTHHAVFQEKTGFKLLTADVLTTTTLAGEPVRSVLVNAPGNQAAIGEEKVTVDNGWFAARPSGTKVLTKYMSKALKDSTTWTL